MTIKNAEGGRITDKALNVSVGERQLPSDTILHFLGIDPCFSVTLGSSGIEVVNTDGRESSLRAAVEHVYPLVNSTVLEVSVDAVRRRLEAISVSAPAQEADAQQVQQVHQLVAEGGVVEGRS